MASMKTKKTAVGIIVFGIVLLAFSANCPAQPVAARYNLTSYDQASESPSFIRFQMKSTKMGLITTSFDGFIKDFSIKGMLTKASAEKISVSFPVKAMDTDIDARNEKMHDFCLDAEKNPLIQLRFEDPVNIDGKAQSLEGRIVIRGEEKRIDMDISVTHRAMDFLVHGVARAKLSELGIPDPSIWIASVDEQIDIEFQAIIPYKDLGLTSWAPPPAEKN